MNQEEIDRQAYWSERAHDIDTTLHSIHNYIAEALVKMKELMEKGMVEGIKADMTNQIREWLEASVLRLGYYDQMVDEMLDEFGWQ